MIWCQLTRIAACKKIVLNAKRISLNIIGTFGTYLKYFASPVLEQKNLNDIGFRWRRIIYLAGAPTYPGAALLTGIWMITEGGVQIFSAFFCFLVFQCRILITLIKRLLVTEYYCGIGIILLRNPTHAVLFDNTTLFTLLHVSALKGPSLVNNDTSLEQSQ
jgi:hypothetical protein